MILKISTQTNLLLSRITVKFFIPAKVLYELKAFIFKMWIGYQFYSHSFLKCELVIIYKAIHLKCGLVIIFTATNL